MTVEWNWTIYAFTWCLEHLEWRKKSSTVWVLITVINFLKVVKANLASSATRHDASFQVEWRTVQHLPDINSHGRGANLELIIFLAVDHVNNFIIMYKKDVSRYTLFFFQKKIILLFYLFFPGYRLPAKWPFKRVSVCECRMRENHENMGNRWQLF